MSQKCKNLGVSKFPHDWLFLLPSELRVKHISAVLQMRAKAMVLMVAVALQHCEDKLVHQPPLWRWEEEASLSSNHCAQVGLQAQQGQFSLVWLPRLVCSMCVSVTHSLRDVGTTLRQLLAYWSSFRLLRT